MAQHHQRSSSHPYSEKTKNKPRSVSYQSTLYVGDIVYLISDRNKLRARERYIVTVVNELLCQIKRFTGSKLRATSYKVKLSECYVIPTQQTTSRAQEFVDDPDDDPPALGSLLDEPPATDLPTEPYDYPPSPPKELTRPYHANPATLDFHDTQYEEDTHANTDTTAQKLTPQPALTSDTPTHEINQRISSRTQRTRKIPNYLNDYFFCIKEA